MNRRPILIVAGEPNSVFLEILFKAYKAKKFSSPLILIASHRLLKLQMKTLKFKKKINLLNLNKLYQYKLNNNSINLINEDLKIKKAFQKKNKNSKKYINNCFEIAIKLIKNGFSNKLINGPISKKKFLNKKFLGMTEYFAKKFEKKNVAMLIFNKSLSVCPITTHLPLKKVAKKINKKTIIQKVDLINSFYKKNFGFKPKIASTGLNPHCESVDIFNEDKKILVPTIKYLKHRGIRISGPFPADTIFLKSNRKNYNVILGMYHDQVLTPIKTLFEYNAINITLGLPFVRISPDHGPNESMLGKNSSNPLSLIEALKFLDKIK